MRVGFSLGLFVGVPLAGVFGLTGLVRRARAVHPRGLVFSAQVSPAESIDPKYLPLAKRLSNESLIRVSNTIWKRSFVPFDMLGVAVRFGWKAKDAARVRSKHQDLLCATVQHLFTLPFAPVSTQTESFFANVYYGITPFYIDGIGPVKFRVTTSPSAQIQATNREDEILKLTALGQRAAPKLMLEVAELASPQKWRRLVDIRIDRPAQVDQEALRFSPDNCGLGIRPIGFINGLRRYAYLASQGLRPNQSAQKANRDAQQRNTKTTSTRKVTAKPPSKRNHAQPNGDYLRMH